MTLLSFSQGVFVGCVCTRVGGVSTGMNLMLSENTFSEPGSKLEKPTNQPNLNSRIWCKILEACYWSLWAKISVFYLRRTFQTTLLLWMILPLGYQLLIQFHRNDNCRTRGIHAEQPGEWSGCSHSLPFRPVHACGVGSVRETLIRSFVHFSSLRSFMKTICLPLALSLMVENTTDCLVAFLEK